MAQSLLCESPCSLEIPMLPWSSITYFKLYELTGRLRNKQPNRLFFFYMSIDDLFSLESHVIFCDCIDRIPITQCLVIDHNLGAQQSPCVCKNTCTDLAVIFNNISKAYLSVRCRYCSKLMDVDQTLSTTYNYSLGMPSKFETKESNSSLKNCEL